MRLAVFTKNRTNPAYGAARVGAERAAAAGGASIKHYVPETPDDPQEQSALIDQALAARPDAFILSPVHPTRGDAAIRRIAVSGIPIVSFVSPVQAVPVVAHVGADDRALARGMAEYLIGRLGGRGRVLVVGGPIDSATGIERLAGFQEAIAAHPSVVAVAHIAGDYSRAIAKARAAEWLAAHDAPDACLVANDVMALGVLEALDDRQVHAAVVGVNAIPEAVAAIAAGRLLASADYSAMQMAFLAVECAIRHLHGRSVQRYVELPVRIVDATNWRAWDVPYDQRTLFTLDELTAA